MQVKLSDYLASSGKSQKEIAKALGISRQAISQYLLNMATPTLDHALRMRELFGISIDSWRRQSRVGAKRAVAR